MWRSAVPSSVSLLLLRDKEHFLERVKFAVEAVILQGGPCEQWQVLVLQLMLGTFAAIEFCDTDGLPMGAVCLLLVGCRQPHAEICSFEHLKSK